MAKVTVEFPDDIVKKLAKLETRTDAVLEKTLQAGADVVNPVFQTKLAGAIGRNTKRKSTSTGQLVSALGVSPVKTADDGSVDIKIGFNDATASGQAGNGALLGFAHANSGMILNLAPITRRPRRGTNLGLGLDISFVGSLHGSHRLRLFLCRVRLTIGSFMGMPTRLPA